MGYEYIKNAMMAESGAYCNGKVYTGSGDRLEEETDRETDKRS